jgi:uncharacterized membrane protein
MNTVGIVIFAIFLLTFPAVAIKLPRRVPKLRWLSPIVLCYAVGILLAQMPFMHILKSTAKSASEGSVLLALPLLLFSADLKGWLKSAPKAVLSFVVALFASCTSAVIAFYSLGSTHERAADIAGMLVGIFTGGTPNMSAIGIALEVPNELFVLVHSAEVALGALYLLFLLTLAHPILSKVTPATEREGPIDDEGAPELPGPTPRTVGLSLGLSILCVGLSVGGVLLVFGKLAVAAVILMVTTSGIAMSFVQRVRRLPGTYETGEYLLLIFSVAVGTMAGWEEIVASFSSVFTIVALVLGAAILIHYTLCIILRVDTDTAIITSTAAVFGPAFVGPVASALGNRGVVVSGVMTGIVGYSVGNYLGLTIAWWLSS